MNQAENQVENASPLGLWDAVSIIVGVVVGTAIFRIPALVFANTSGPWTALGAWFLGGVLSLCGAFCYAELATTYPRDGGDYEYLSRAFGPWLGFLFGWAQLTIVIGSNIGAMAYAFADYAVVIWPSLPSLLAAVVPVAVLTLINSLGTVLGKSTQNLLTSAKVLGLGSIVIAACAEFLSAGAPATPAPVPSTLHGEGISFGLAMVFVLYGYGGWNHAAFVAAEVRDQRRNVPRALIFGIAGITAIYLVINASYLLALGSDVARSSTTPAADVLEKAFGHRGATAISLLVMISALGAINGMIFTGARIYATLGADFPKLAWLGAWNARTGTPFAAVVSQGAVAVGMVLAVGTATGRRLFDTALGSLGIPPLAWGNFLGGFETLVAGTAPVFWSFFLLTGAAMIVLRLRDRAAPRPFRAPFFPLPPLLLGATSAYMLHSSLLYAGWLSLLGFVPLALGLAAYSVVGRPKAGCRTPI